MNFRSMAYAVSACLLIAGVAAPPSQAGAAPAPEAETTNDQLVWQADPAAPQQSFAALAVWAACGVTTSNTKIVRTFSRAATAGATPYTSSGTSNLACGTAASWGYRHIVANHLSQWEARAAVASENWRDTADYGIEWALKDPDRVTYRSKNDTYCFSRKINLVNKRTNQVVGAYYPNVVVARGTKNIITAIPASSQCT